MQDAVNYVLRGKFIGLFILKFFIIFRERKRERETSVCCSTHLCIHWFILACALTGDQTNNLSVSGWCSNQLSYPARAAEILIMLTYHRASCWPTALMISIMVIRPGGLEEALDALVIHICVGSWMIKTIKIQGLLSWQSFSSEVVWSMTRYLSQAWGKLL